MTDRDWLTQIAEWLEEVRTEKHSLEEIQMVVARMRLHLERQDQQDFLPVH